MPKLYFGDGTSAEVEEKRSGNKVIPWKITQHRGCTINGVFEETLPAFYESMLLEYDGFECDVQWTSDGVAVLVHGSPIAGTINGVETSLSVTSSTYEELSKLVLGTHATYGDIHVCTLEEALRFCYYHDKFLVLDSINSAAEATNIANLVVKNGMAGKCIYMLVFHTDDVDEIAEAILDVDRTAKVAVDSTLTDNLTSTTYSHLTTNQDQILILVKMAHLTKEVTDMINASGYKMYFWDWNADRTDVIAEHAVHHPAYVQYGEGANAKPMIEQYLAELDFGKGIY